MVNSLSLEFEPFINYESIICCFFPNSQIVNAACIGVHFTPSNEVFLHIYPETDSIKLLQPGITFAINFSDNFFDYAIAALVGWNKGESEPEFEESDFQSLTPVPILKNAWASVECQVKKFDENMDAAKHNFLLRGFFKKKEKQRIKDSLNNAKHLQDSVQKDKEEIKK